MGSGERYAAISATWMAFSYTLCAQGTALFMAGGLLNALTSMKPRRKRAIATEFKFQHRLCHDFESLIWVVVYAMMIHQRNTFAATDLEMFEEYKRYLDLLWAVHAYTNLLQSHDHMMTTGCSIDSLAKVNMWFPDPPKAAFFHNAMHVIGNQRDGDFIMYEALCILFKKHIDMAQELQVFDVVPNEPC